MRILIVTDRYHPEVAAPSVRLGDHASRWVAAGHEVTVVTCAPNFPRGELFPGYRNRLYQEEWLDGVRVVRVWSYMTANEGFVKRTLDYVSFMLSAAFFCWRYPAFDVLLASSPPLFTAVAGWLIALFRRRPWAFEIRDLWPASIKAVGAGDGPVIAFFERLELFLYRRADLLVALTESFREDLESRGVPSEKIEVVRNGVDFERFSHHPGAADARREIGVDEDVFLAGYVGTTGMAHGLETLLDAAALSASRKDVRFLIMGEGAERAKLEEQVRSRGLDNVIFRNFVSHAEMPNYLAALDASIVHLRPDPLFKTVIPSKIFEAMAAELPIVMAVEGESAEIVEAAQAGLCVPSGDPAALAEATLKIADDGALRQHPRKERARGCAKPPQSRPSCDATARAPRRDDLRSRGVRMSAQVTVIGGSGFIGTRLVRRLREAGHSVTIVDKAKSPAYPELVRIADVRDPAALREACRGSEVIYNLAAEHRDDVRPLSLYDEVNVGGATNTCEAARELGVSTSSSSAPWPCTASPRTPSTRPERRTRSTTTVEPSSKPSGCSARGMRRIRLARSRSSVLPSSSAKATVATSTTCCGRSPRARSS